jgi:glucose/arabinose dehydrogenase
MLEDNLAVQPFESIFAQTQLPDFEGFSAFGRNGSRNSPTIAFIDSNISSAIDVMAGVQADIKIFLDPTRDGISQITETLGQYQHLSGISIVSHGNTAEVQLGNSLLNENSVSQYSDQLQQWKSALAPEADILFFGCGIAAGESGKSFIDRISRLTDADIAASIDVTGNSAKGGNWNLEYATGNIETSIPFSNSFISSYQGLLPTFYLSDLTATAATNGWGAIERDRSNGELGATDGNTLTLNGVTYAKGLGVHSGSDTTYALSGNYTRFVSDIGVDDEVGTNGSVVFQVLADGVQIYDSGLMTGSSATKTIDVDVTGRQNLRLVVTDSGNGNTYDHADWANARVENGPPAPDTTLPTATLNANPLSVVPNSNSPYTFNVTYSDNVAVNSSTLDSTDLVVTGPNGYSQLATFVSAIPSTNGSPLTATYRITPQGGTWDTNEAGTYTVTLQANQVRDTSSNAVVAATLGTFQVNVSTTTSVYLSDLTATAATNGWGAIERDRSNGEQGATDGTTLTLNGVTYAKGLGVHSGSDTTYALSRNYTRFVSDIGVDDEVGTNGSVVFQVLADGVQIYDSGLMTGSSATKTIDVDVTGRQNLRLVVTDSGNGNTYDHADWANARLISIPLGPDNTPPAPALTASNISSSTSSPYTFTITYADASSVNVATINGNTTSSDVRVTGVNGYSQLAQLVSFTPNTNSPTVTATYQITAPDGMWNWNDRGTYTANLLAGAVQDTLGNTTTTDTTLGTFQNTVDSTFVFATNSSQVAEGNPINITVRRQGDISGTASIDYLTGGNSTAVPGVNYTPIANTTLTFGSNIAERTITLQTLNDGVANTNRTVSLLIQNPVGADLGPSRTSSITINDGAAPTLTYLSDLPYTTLANGYGPVERDGSNGEQAANDGRTLSLGGTPYNKGLGVHANSQITYNLGGAYNSFFAYVGIDDEVGVNGSLTFQVLADGDLLYDSGVMTGASNTQLANVNVTGKQTLSLVVNGGENIDYDHADWADAQLVVGSYTPPPPPSPAPTVVREQVVQGLNQPTTFDWSPDGQLMFIAEKGGVVRTFAQPTNIQLAPVTQYATGIQAHSVTSADLNRDGRLDLAVANSGSNNISILFGNGNGTFAPATNFSAGSEPKSVSTADLNGDGWLDLFTANQNSNNVSVLFNNRNGTFAPAVNYAGAIGSHEVVAGDVDGDNDIDIAVTGWGGTIVRVMRNNGAGVFSSFVDYNVGSNPHTLQLADFNGDNRPDLAVANQGSDNVNIFINNGTGSFGSTSTSYFIGDGPHSLRAGDLNGDGRIDLAAANEYSNTIGVLLGNVTGGFTPVVNYATGSVPKGVGIGDINGDGKLDLISANTAGNYPNSNNPGGNTISVLLGNGNGTFAAPTTYTTGRTPFSVNVADFNGDNKADIATANWDTNDVGVLLNNTINQLPITLGLQPTPFIDISAQVNNVADRGLLGLTVDPFFGRNQNRDFVYLLFTYDPPETATNTGLAGRDGRGNRPARLIRVTADPTTNYTTAIAGSEVVLLGKNSNWQYTSRPDLDSTLTENIATLPSGIVNGSTITAPIALVEDADITNVGRDYSAADNNFDRNNNIQDYLAGDSTSHSIGQVQFALDGSLYVTVGDGTSYNLVDPRSTRVQDVDNLSGKLLRINPLTGQGYTDNPFYNGNLDSNRSKVWSLGLRNSFRFTFNPTTNTAYLGEVGWNTWEEINLATKGSNFGWPYFEGPNQNLGYNTLPQAQAFYTSGQAVEPLLTRNHTANLNSDGLATTALIMGDFYTGNSLPSIYNGALIYNDVGLGTVYATTLNPNGSVNSTQIFDNLPYIVDMETGPDGYLYYASLYGNAIGRWKPA